MLVEQRAVPERHRLVEQRLDRAVHVPEAGHAAVAARLTLQPQRPLQQQRTLRGYSPSERHGTDNQPPRTVIRQLTIHSTGGRTQAFLHIQRVASGIHAGIYFSP